MKSPKQSLKDATTALTLVERARALFCVPEYNPLVSALEANKRDLESIIRASDEARYGTDLLRPDFYYGLNTTRISIHRPGPTDDLPYISVKTYECLKLVLASDDIRVDAPYDVEVKSNGISYGIIKGHEP